MLSPLFPKFEKRISVATDQILRHQVDPWLLMSQGLTVKHFDGRPISYGGIRFEGSPRQVFWSGYIEPYLENMVITELSVGTALANERGVDVRELIPEIQGLLKSAIAKVLARMADVDRRLRGGGFPDQVPLRRTQSEFAHLVALIDIYAQAELQMANKSSTLQRWYDQNTAWVWVIGLLFSFIGILASFL